MNTAFESWQFWAVLSAVFAALTAIFAKVGIENINSDFATLIRTVVILLVLAGIVTATGQAQALGTISTKTYTFLILSGLATGASWLCYFRALKIGNAAQVAPIDKLSVVLVAVFGAIFLGERLGPANWLGVALIAAGADWNDIDTLAVAIDGGHGQLFVQRFAKEPMKPLSDLASLIPDDAARLVSDDRVVGNAAATLVGARGRGQAIAAGLDAARVVDLPASLRALAAVPIYGRAPDAKPMA